VELYAAVFSLAVAAGELAVNPCAWGGRLYDGTRIDKIWSPEQIDAIWIGGTLHTQGFVRSFAIEFVNEVIELLQRVHRPAGGWPAS
jgi:hypothetical protein